MSKKLSMEAFFQRKTKEKKSAKGTSEKGVSTESERPRYLLSSFLRVLVWVAAGLTAGILVFLIGYILIKGVPHLIPELFAWKYNSENVSMLPSLINTFLMVVLALLIAGPLGIFAAIYLVEYASRGNKFVKLIRLTAETLSGIPSIVYGLFGMLFFVYKSGLGWGNSLLAGACTVAIMILPLIMRQTEESLKAVPDSYREGSFGLGAGRLRTVFCIVLPAAVPGILAGVILAIGRIVGETAALLYTSSTLAEVPNSLFKPASTLALHMYTLSSEGFHVDQAYATAVVLLILVVVINWLARVAARHLTKG